MLRLTEDHLDDPHPLSGVDFNCALNRKQGSSFACTPHGDSLSLLQQPMTG